MLRDLPQFDAAAHDYDLQRYPFAQWCLEKVQEAGYEVDDLEKLHEVLAPEDQPALTKRLIQLAGEPAFQELIYGYVDEYVKPLLGPEVAIQRYPNIRFVRPARPEMVLPYHQGIWVGHGWGEGTIWMPFTRAFDSNSMQIVGLAESKKLTHECISERWKRSKMQDVLGEATHPCNVNAGQAIWFTEGNIHGNVENTTGITRVSMDFRVLEKGGQFHRKPPGGYFVVPGAYEHVDDQSRAEKRDAQRVTISYCEAQTDATRGIPIPLQRLQIRDWCQKRNIKFSFEHVELEGLLHCPILTGLIEQDQPDEIVMYSIFALPEDRDDRKMVLNAALKHNVTLHFTNELMTMRNEKDRDAIEATLRFTRDFTSPVVTTKDLAEA